MKGKGYVNDRTRWSDEWATPRDFFDAIDAEFHFTLDAASSDWSAKCENYYSVGGLERPWRGHVVWLNPPYSDIGPWLDKAWCSAVRDGTTVVALVPCVPDRKWWADHVEGKASEIRHVVGKRLYFTASEGAEPKRAPFPSVVLVYRPADQGQASHAKGQK